MTVPRPYALLAEVTYRCPLHCPYCSNPADHCRATASVADPEGGRRSARPTTALTTAHATTNNGELTTEEWKRVIREAAALGVLQIGFSGGEPLARPDLAKLVHEARETKLYTNLITSGIGLDEDRLRALRDAALDSIQLSFQSDESNLADEIAGARAHERKRSVAAKIRASGIPLSLNFVIHRRNIDRLAQMIELAEALDVGLGPVALEHGGEERRLRRALRGQAVDVAGGLRRLKRIRTMPARHGAGGRYFFRLGLELQGRDSALVIRFAPWSASGVFPDWSLSDSRVLVPNATGFELEYADGTALDTSWVRQWSDPQRLPSRIRISLRTPAGDWPYLTIAMRQLPGGDTGRGGFSLGPE